MEICIVCGSTLGSTARSSFVLARYFVLFVSFGAEKLSFDTKCKRAVFLLETFGRRYSLIVITVIIAPFTIKLFQSTDCFSTRPKLFLTRGSLHRVSRAAKRKQLIRNSRARMQ